MSEEKLRRKAMTTAAARERSARKMKAEAAHCSKTKHSDMNKMASGGKDMSTG